MVDAELNVERRDGESELHAKRGFDRPEGDKSERLLVLRASFKPLREVTAGLGVFQDEVAVDESHERARGGPAGLRPDGTVDITEDRCARPVLGAGLYEVRVAPLFVAEPGLDVTVEVHVLVAQRRL